MRLPVGCGSLATSDVHVRSTVPVASLASISVALFGRDHDDGNRDRRSSCNCRDEKPGALL